jgi:hypothetical protein
MGIRKDDGRPDTARTLVTTPADRRLASLWWQVARLFPSDDLPAPAWRWYEPNRSEPRTLPWSAMQESLGNAARRAHRLSPAQQAELRAAGVAFYRGLEAEFLSEFPVEPTAPSISTLVVAETDLEGPVNAIQARLLRDESPSTLAIAEDRIGRYLPAMVALYERVCHKRRAGQSPQGRAA